MQPGVVALRAAVTAAWEDDLRAVRQDAYDTGGDKEALVFIQRFYALVSRFGRRSSARGARAAWSTWPTTQTSPGPGSACRRLESSCETTATSWPSRHSRTATGRSKPNPSLGLDRELKVAGVGGFVFVQELYRTMVAFLQAALGVDLQLTGSAWLYEQIAASYFVANGRWPTVGELYQRAPHASSRSTRRSSG